MTTLRGQEWFWVAPGKRCWQRAVGKTGVVIKIDDFQQPNPTIAPPGSGAVAQPPGVLAIFVESCLLTSPNSGVGITDQIWSISFRMDAALFTPLQITTPTYAGSPAYMNMLTDDVPCSNANATDLIILPNQWQEFAIDPAYGDFYIGLKLSTSSPLADAVVPVMIALFQSTQG